MASFDIAEALRAGYIFFRDHLRLIVRIGTLPAMVKLISYIAILSLGMDDNVLRKGLLLFPSVLLEGYLVCTLVRVALFPQEALIQPPGAGAYDHYKRRGQDILAGTVIYALLELLAMFAFGLSATMRIEPDRPDLSPAEMTSELVMASVFVSIFLLWIFRLVWLYIPVTCGYSMREYMRKIRGFTFSFYIFAVWLLASLPVYFIFSLLASVFMSLTGHSESNPSHIFEFLIVGVRSVLEIVVVIITSVCIGHGTMQVLTGRNVKKNKE